MSNQLRHFECCINYALSGEYKETVVASSHSKARYKFYLGLRADEPYSDYFKYIKVRSIGTATQDDVYRSMFTDRERFEDIAERRGISFSYQGMMVDVSGKKGRIIGGNSSCNLDILFDGDSFTSNCHPHWEITYYDNDGVIIKDYKKVN